jgi:hypothetical protein
VTGRVYPTIGIDPGQRWVGIAARIDGRCLDAATLDRGRLPAQNEEHYFGQPEAGLAKRLLDGVDAMMRRHLAAAEEAAEGWAVARLDLPWRVAVEGVVVPGAWENRQQDTGKRIAKLISVIGTVAVLGEVVGAFNDAVVVHPRHLGDRGHARHGDVLAHLGPYPKELVGKRLRHFMANEHFKGERTHERAAWAVAGAAQLARPLSLRSVRQELVS